MQTPHHRFCGTLLLAFLVCCPLTALAADDVMLSIRAPAETRLVVNVTYFENGQPTRASVQGLTADDDTDLKLGSPEGIEVQVATAASADVRLELVAGDEVVSAATADGDRSVRLRFGQIAGDWKSQPLDVRANPEDKAVWRRWQEVLTAGDLRAFQIAQASEPEAAEAITFDLPGLKSYLSTVKKALGSPRSGNALASVTDLVAWDVGGNQRVVAAEIAFDRGSVTFEVMHLGNAITEIKFESAQLGEQWFSGPVELDFYSAAADGLVTDLFSGNAQSAWSRFGGNYREAVSVQQLTELSDSLTNRFGKIDSVSTKFTRLLPIDYDQFQQTLVVVSAINAGQNQCLAEAKFVFDTSPNRISKGQLASVFVRPVWKTAQPLHQKAAEALLALVSEGGEFTLPSALTHAPIDTAELAESFRAICEMIGPGFETDWDLWRSSGTEAFTRADGTLTLASGESADVRLDYVGEEVAAVTVVTPGRAVSTLNCVQRPGDFAAVAEEFWKALLGDKVESAYGSMSADLQQTQTVDVLRFTVATSGFVLANQVGQSVARLCTQADRKSSTVVSVYSIATLEDGTLAPLRCDVRRNVDKMEVVSFETEVEAVFPVATASASQFANSQELVKQFVGGDVDAIVGLVSDEQRIELDSEVLARFLEKLHAELGDWQLDPQMRLIHRYSGGSRNEVLSGRLTLGEREVLFQVQTRLGKLNSFSFQHHALSDFLTPEFLDASLRQRALVFVGAWFATPAQRDDLLRKVLDHELAQEAALDDFGRLRQYLLRRNGAFEDTAVESVVSDTENRSATLICGIDATSEDYKIELTFTWNATSLRISAVEVVR